MTTPASEPCIMEHSKEGLELQEEERGEPEDCVTYHCFPETQHRRSGGIERRESRKVWGRFSFYR